jgi:hypothetical protein
LTQQPLLARKDYEKFTSLGLSWGDWHWQDSAANSLIGHKEFKVSPI